MNWFLFVSALFGLLVPWTGSYGTPVTFPHVGIACLVALSPTATAPPDTSPGSGSVSRSTKRYEINVPTFGVLGRFVGMSHEALHHAYVDSSIEEVGDAGPQQVVK